jgi:hypothetical protein
MLLFSLTVYGRSLVLQWYDGRIRLVPDKECHYCVQTCDFLIEEEALSGDGRFTMGHLFLDLPNVIGSPHNSAGGGAWRDEYLRRAVRNCRRALLGEAPQNLIGPAERML